MKNNLVFLITIIVLIKTIFVGFQSGFAEDRNKALIEFVAAGMDQQLSCLKAGQGQAVIKDVFYPSQRSTTADVDFVFKGPKIRWNWRVSDGLTKAFISDGTKYVEYVPRAKKAWIRPIENVPKNFFIDYFDPRYFHGLQGISLSRVLQRNKSGGKFRVDITVEDTVKEGMDMFRVRLHSKVFLVDTEAWVSPREDFVVREYRIRLRGKLCESFQGTYKERPGSTWFVDDGVLMIYQAGKLQRRRQIKIRDVQLNHDVDEGVFKLGSFNMPRGTVVWDMRYPVPLKLRYGEKPITEEKADEIIAGEEEKKAQRKR